MKDKRGVLLRAGDRIAYAVRDGNTPVLRLATVLESHEDSLVVDTDGACVARTTVRISRRIIKL